MDVVRSSDRIARGVLHVGNPSGFDQDGRVLRLRTVLAAALARRDLEHPLHHGADPDDVFEVGTVDLLDLGSSAPNLDVGRRSGLGDELQPHAPVHNLTHAQCARVLPLVPTQRQLAKT